MFPIGDENAGTVIKPLVNWTLIGLCIAVFIYELILPPARLDAPSHRGVGSYLRCAGRLHPPLPAWEGTGARLLRLFRSDRPRPRLGDDRDLVRSSALQRVRVTRRTR